MASFAPAKDAARPLHLVFAEDLSVFAGSLPPAAAGWLRACGFRAAPGEVLLLPEDGGVGGAVLGLGPLAQKARQRFAVAQAVGRLPAGSWRIATPMTPEEAEEAALAWLLAGYSHTLKSGVSPSEPPALAAPEGVDEARILAIARGECLTRQLINTPANLMGPDELQAAAEDLARDHGAAVEVIEGTALLDANFPMIHAVGRASDRAPRLIDLRWGGSGPLLTLVGKGIVFDTGGLDLKPASAMGLMKKDMGGAAAVLGLAHMIMATAMPLRLRVLLPVAENAVSGPAFRPGDVLTSRAGLTVEVNNTDAEGRLVLADALAYGGEENPDLMVSMATLTGAARVAVGPDLAPFYTGSDTLAAALSAAGQQVRDPVWRMPFHDPYEALIEPAIADLDNAPKGGFAGSITAALFLRRFAGGAAEYTHFDIYGWQPAAAPARPAGGAGQGARALFAALPRILGLDGSDAV
ncbi:leucyl aminopeptidase family protein [Mangrovicoccus algicola]|uniref:Leucyl aminopeptidase family protein n=1 Tax=Mangrovicoccus algicola TaxID=2771008 RepID=A0A8J6ZAU9_9RHOB|nr:leucyl aminopeptidase family protein [Mangrovicoccus algicola]